MNTNDRIQLILGHLQAVDHERAARSADVSLAQRATAVREFQAERLQRTHADLLASPETRAAATFFLNELYGAQDFLERDQQFQRIVPTLVRLFSTDVADTVTLLAELHAMSERLDTHMARCLLARVSVAPLSPEDYGRAWREVGERTMRERQIECVGVIGQRLIRYTTHPSLGRALRLMRLPAKAAGLQDLQSFLERGFEAFGTLRDPQGFIRIVQDRERLIARDLFDPPS